MEQTETRAGRKTGTMAVMGKEGDTKFSWDKNNPADVAIARRTFNRYRADKYVAYRIMDGSTENKGEIMDEFDPEVERIIFSPQMRGG